MLVAEDLDLDVARVEDELLDEDAVIAEAVQPLALHAFKALAHIGFAISKAHPLAAAAGAGLHHHRIADLVRDAHRVLGILDLADEAGDDVDARLFRQLLALDLVPHRRDRAHGRPDEGDALLRQRLGKGGALGEEAVARMHGLGPGLLAGGDDLVGDQVAFGRRRRADMHRLVRHGDEGRAGIGIGIDRDGCDPHLPRRGDDPAGDLAAIGNQDFREQGLGPLSKGRHVRSGYAEGLRGKQASGFACRLRRARRHRRRGSPHRRARRGGRPRRSPAFAPPCPASRYWRGRAVPAARRRSRW